MKVYVQRGAKKQLKICPQSDGSVTVIAPRHLSHKQIASHVADNINWITEHLKRVASNEMVTPKSVGTQSVGAHFATIDNQSIKDIFAGKKTLLCGQLYNCSSSVYTQTHLKEECLFIQEKQFSSRDSRVKAIKTFLKRMANSVLSQEVSKVGSIVALCPTKIQFRDLHGLWCSCRDAELRAIILDYRVIQLPQALQNFVIAHAFAHFVKSGHGEDYFKCLSGYLPNYQRLQGQMEEYNFLLDV